MPEPSKEKTAYITKSREETIELGRRIGEKLSPGDIICISGDLGAGKTVLTSGIAKGLGAECEGYITSPTFTIVNEYDGKIPFFHFDVYRVHDPDELYEIGFEEYFSREGVVCIEWAELIYDLIPEKRIEVNIRKAKNLDIKKQGEEREITITGALEL